MGFAHTPAKRKPAPMPRRRTHSDDLDEKLGQPASESSAFQRNLRIKKKSQTSIPLSLILIFPCIVILLIFFLFIRHSTSPDSLLQPETSEQPLRLISEKHDKVFVTGCQVPDTKAPRANAAFVILARNEDLGGVIRSIKSIERHFNRWFHYPYVFLNNEEFSFIFKKLVRNFVSGPAEFGQINTTMWGFPDWVDSEEARERIRKQGDAAIMYGGVESYHHMCRFYSGFFYKHPLLMDYDWYWRIEPDVKYFCDITYDPFIEMERANKTYGFTIAVKELKETVPNIFRYASAYKRGKNLTSKGLWEMFTIRPEEDEDFFPENDPRRNKPESLGKVHKGFGVLPEIDPDSMEGEVYNMCHFWSNFEIARLDFFRSKEYEDYFQMMDRSGGFWTERWGDAPVHSLAVGALLAPSDIHYFRDIGYRHTTIQHCPANAPLGQLPREPFLERTTKDPASRKEEDDYWASPDPPKENGVGCRCKCDTDVVEVETKRGSCMAEWVQVAGGWAS